MCTVMKIIILYKTEKNNNVRFACYDLKSLFFQKKIVGIRYFTVTRKKIKRPLLIIPNVYTFFFLNKICKPYKYN